jgi:hypothetical protein
VLKLIAMATTDDQGSSVALVTGEDLPSGVQALLKSYELADLRWEKRNVRHTVVVEVLTRGHPDDEQWLWKTLGVDEVRALLREFGGAGADNEGRVVLRQKAGLSESEVPPRPSGFVPWHG